MKFTLLVSFFIFAAGCSSTSESSNESNLTISCPGLTVEAFRTALNQPASSAASPLYDYSCAVEAVHPSSMPLIGGFFESTARTQVTLTSATEEPSQVLNRTASRLISNNQACTLNQKGQVVENAEFSIACAAPTARAAQ